jgi:hypothetical protein
VIGSGSLVEPVFAFSGVSDFSFRFFWRWSASFIWYFSPVVIWFWSGRIHFFWLSRQSAWHMLRRILQSIVIIGDERCGARIMHTEDNYLQHCDWETGRKETTKAIVWIHLAHDGDQRREKGRWFLDWLQANNLLKDSSMELVFWTSIKKSLVCITELKAWRWLGHNWCALYHCCTIHIRINVGHSSQTEIRSKAHAFQYINCVENQENSTLSVTVM